MKTILILVITILIPFAGMRPVSAQPYLVRGEVPAEGGFEAVTLVQGLEHPWGMAWLPNGDVLITERPGRLRLVRDGRLVAEPIEGVAEVFASGQGGLLDIGLHPEFEQNGKLYFTYAHGDAAANRTRVATAVLKGGRLDNWRMIFEVATAKSGGQHFGSRLLWLPDGTLLVSIGDGGNPPVRLGADWIRNQAQKRDSHLGKLLRLNPDGSVPADNPFVSDADAEAAVWSYGHRNIQGLAYDPLRSMVWASEHGALGGDELNAVQAGNNYGWPAVTYSREYFDGSKISPATSKAGLVDPKVVWSSAIAPSGLVVYTAERFPQWRGDVLAGGLRSQDIRRIDLDETGKVVGQTALRIGQRVRDVRQGPDGLVYVLTDEAGGSLIRLQPSDDKDSPRAP